MPRASELYPVRPWMEKYFLMFNNTGGNDVVELLHDDDTSAFANVVRYLLICSVRSQYTLLTSCVPSASGRHWSCHSKRWWPRTTS